MTRDWESWLQTAAQPASETEQNQRDRTEKLIREAIHASGELPSTVRVYVKGSYATNTNVRRDADVDIAVEWTEQFKVMTWGKTKGMTAEQLGYTPVSSMISAEDFRARVERALVEALGSGLVDTRGDKHIDVAETSGTLEADVVPCLEMHRYDAPGVDHVGHRIFPKSGGYVDNFPQQNYDNGVVKNKATGGRYKAMVRCVKRLEAELVADGSIPREYPGYLIECLLYNVPNSRFGHARLYDDLQAVFRYLWNGLQNSDIYETWAEVNDLLMIFRGRPDRSPSNALKFIDIAWDRIGVS